MATEFFLSNPAHFVSDNPASVEEAVANGSYKNSENVKSKYDSISILESMGVDEILKDIVERSVDGKRFNSCDISLVAFSSIYESGNGVFWQPASFIQNVLKNEDAMAFGIRQGCNGQMVGLELTINHLLANPKNLAALSVSADIFRPSFDRWNADYGIVYGDGGAAVVVSRNEGDQQILSFRSLHHGQLNEVHRTNRRAGNSHRIPIEQNDIKGAKKRFIERFGTEPLTSTSVTSVKFLVDACLNEAGLKLADVDHFILPNVGENILESNYLPALRVSLGNTTWNFGKTIGHIGSGDAIAGLSFLSNKIERGQITLVISAGAGFSWSVLFIQAT